MVTMDAHTLAALADLYLLRCEVEGKSPRTVRAYRETLARFQRATTELQAPDTAAEITSELVTAEGCIRRQISRIGQSRMTPPRADYADAKPPVATARSCQRGSGADSVRTLRSCHYLPEIASAGDSNDNNAASPSDAQALHRPTRARPLLACSGPSSARCQLTRCRCTHYARHPRGE